MKRKVGLEKQKGKVKKKGIGICFRVAQVLRHLAKCSKRKKCSNFLIRLIEYTES